MSYSPQSFLTATSTSLGGVEVGTGLSITGAGLISNAGVTGITGGTVTKVSAATGNITITDVGVFSITGTSNQVTASASTGAVTLSLPQSIATTSTVTFGTLTASTSLVGLGYTSLGSGVASSSLYNAVPLLVRSGAGSANGGVNAWFSQSGDKLFVASVNDAGSYIPFVLRASTYAFQNSANGGNGQLGVHILDVTNNYAAFNTTTQYSSATLNVNGNAYINGVTTSTSGISFNNPSATVNSTLNDYETGTFTPLLTPSSGSATVTYGATVNTGSEYFGRYTKIGNMVFVQIAFWVNAIGTGGSGNVTVTGLPFTTTSIGYDSASIGTINNIPHTSSRTQFGFRTNPGTTNATMWEFGLASGAVGDSPVPWSSLPTASQFNITMSIAYRANF